MIAAIVRGPLGRLVPVGVVLLALQTTFFVDVRPGGVVVQILTAFAAAAGVAGGPERGMIAGFTLGVMFDLWAGSPLGSSSLTMGIAGMVGGTVSYLNIDVHWWLAALFVALGSGAGELAVPAVRLVIGETDVFVARWYLVVPIVSLAAGVLSPLFVPLGRWCFRLGPTEWKVPAE